jgi:hypothetical protein
MRETWQRAAAALRDAAAVDVVGYSLPLTDLLVASLLADSLMGRTVEARVVNLAPAPVVESLKTATGLDSRVVLSVDEYVEDVVARASAALADLIRDTGAGVPSETRLLVGWNSEYLAPVVTVTREADRVRVLVDDLGDQNPTAPRVGRPPHLAMSALVDVIRNGDRLEAAFTNGATTALIGIDRFRTDVGASSCWQVLLPADSWETLGLSPWLHRAGVRA